MTNKTFNPIFLWTIFAFTFVLLSCNSNQKTSQISEQLKIDIRNTAMVHSPLPMDFSRALETFLLTKPVLESTMLCDMEDISRWSHRGIGEMMQSDTRSVSGNHSLRITAPTRSGQIPPPFGIGFGSARVDLDVGGENWEKYNRISVWIFPDCEGARSNLYLNWHFVNEGEVRLPSEWARDGIHEINLINRQWNHAVLEFPEMPRDKITRISFGIETFGRELTMGDSLIFYIDKIELQVIEQPEVARGWMPGKNRIVYSTTGYGIDSRKTAIINIPNHNGRFEIRDYATNRRVYRGRINSVTSPIGTFETIDFSNLRREGQFVIQIGDVVTNPFYIRRDIWQNSAWRTLNFLFAQRCGFPVPHKHGTCHADHHIRHNGYIVPLNGGWHDAGDLSQNPKQTAEIVHALFELSNRARERGNNDLHVRLKLEAKWGLDYILRARLGDGYRIARAMTNLWTDGIIGTIDDIRNIHVRNSAWENFIYAATKAYAAMSIDCDLMLQEHLVRVAKEDFGYAMERFINVEKEPLLRGEHPNSDVLRWMFSTRVSPSQFMATISWSASLMYQLTGDSYYADIAAYYIQYVIATQRTEPIGEAGIRGFFYRCTDHISTVHFMHQTENQVFGQALIELAKTQPNHPDFQKWDNAIRLYGEFIKASTRFVYPFNMIPSGVHHVDEPINDPLGFYIMHIGVRRDVIDDYREQLRHGIKLDDEHYLRAFPVWFSFRGNSAVHLATGKSAAIIGRYLNDRELIDIAEQQLFWTVGQNPFGQSLIWGEGFMYPQMYVPLPGETVGQMPVGIQTRGNEDVPYWPQFNFCTYKEVWVKPVARWLSLIAEF